MIAITNAKQYAPREQDLGSGDLFGDFNRVAHEQDKDLTFLYRDVNQCPSGFPNDTP
jgi:hypothetical protein